MILETWKDERLIGAARDQPDRAPEYLEVLFRRYHRRVASWCLRICGNKDEASDLAQDVFLRVQSRLESFRMDSRFSTWLFTVTRSVGINRGVSATRRKSHLVSVERLPEPRDPAPPPIEQIERDEAVGRLRTVLLQNLDPLETRVLFLHFARGMSLQAITQMLGLENKSGAKAVVVRAKRKLQRKIGDLTGPAAPRSLEEK